MRLSTIQPISVWQVLQSTGVYRADETKIWMLEDFRQAYAWLVEEMEQRIGPRPSGVCWPVWAWYKTNGQIGRVDLRRREHWTFEPSVCIDFEMPDDQVVLTDFDAWHCVLNNWACVENEAEANLFDRLEKTLSSEAFQQRKKETWQRIFRLDPHEDYYWSGKVEDIQATFWELRLKDVTGVRHCRTYKKNPSH